jgi:hypothetical protein
MPPKKRFPLIDLTEDSDVGPKTRSRLKKKEATTEATTETKTKAVLELREMLECPVCFQSMVSSAVFACPNDHLVCARCKRSNETIGNNVCPTCRVDLNRFPLQRRIVYEKMLSLVNAL